MNKVFISNCYEKLLNCLQSNLFEKSQNPLETTLLVVPSSQTKYFLLRQFLENQEFVAGIEILTLKQAIEKIVSLLPSVTKPILSKDLLAIQIDHEDCAGSELAEFFENYSLFGEIWLDKWQQENKWQQKLWNEALLEWTFPHELRSLVQMPLARRVSLHLFLFASIAKPYREFFEQLSIHWPLHYYFLSPSQHYWGDLITDKKRLYIGKYFAKKGAASDELNQLEQYLKNRNELLGNFGSYAQSLFDYFQDSPFEIQEDYVKNDTVTLLAHIQNDLLDMVAPDEHPSITYNDNSISLHKAGSKMREIEILHNHLLAFCKQSEASPSDILVLAPNIEPYAPLIDYVFNSVSSPFSYKINGVSIKSQPTLSTISMLLSLYESRWEKKDILSLFRSRPFLEKMDFSQEDGLTIENWIESSSIRWGFDLNHVRLILNKATNDDTGTWSNFIEKQYRQLALSSSSINLGEAELFGKFAETLSSLYEMTTKLSSEKMTLIDWMELIEPFVDLPDDSGYFKEELLRLKRLATSCKAIKTPFKPVKTLFDRILTRRIAAVSVGQQTPICFSSIREGSIYSASAIFLIGMEEGSFPKTKKTSSIDQLPPKLAPHPGQIDRYLFLQILLSAKEQLTISYLGVNHEDGKPQGPCSLILELFTYINTYYGHIEPIKHPSIAFHQEYFLKDSLIKSRSIEEFSQASHYYNKVAAPPVEKKNLVLCAKPMQVDISDLMKLAKHPLRFFCNEALGIYLETKSATNEAQKEFILSPLDKGMYRFTLLNDTRRAKQLVDSLPKNLFGQVSKWQLMQEEFLQKDPIFDVTFSSTCKTPFSLSPTHRVYPAIVLKLPDGRKATVTGYLPRLCNKGLVATGTYKFSEIVKYWPGLLALHFIPDVENALVFLREDKIKELSLTNPNEFLRNYLLYYEKAKHGPSPLMPDWSKSLIKNDNPDELKLSTHFSDPYFDFCLPDQEMIKIWQPYINKHLCIPLTV